MQTQRIAITRTDGTLAVMQFVTRQERHGADPGWTREATPANVEAEIAKAGFADTCARWRFIAPEGLPASREYRALWRDNGTAIVVGSAC